MTKGDARISDVGPSPNLEHELLELRARQSKLETENKELRLALVKADAERARYFDLYDLAPLGYFSLSDEGLIIDANLTVALLLGVPRRALVNQPMRRFILEEDQGTWDLCQKQLMETGKPQLCELRAVKKDGEPLWVQMQAAAVRHTDGATEFRVSLSDITERKQAEDAIRRMAQVADAAPSTITVRTIEGGLLYANERTYEMYGYSADEFAALRLRQLMTPPHEQLANARLQELLARGEISFEADHVRKDGTLLPIEVHAKVVCWSGQEVILSVATDITERRRADLALRESEKRFRIIFEQAPLGVALIDSLTGKICEVNPRFAAIVGRARAETSPIDWTCLAHPDDVQKALDNMALLNAGKIPGFAMNTRYRRPDESVVWITMTIAPIGVEDKSDPRHLCMVEEIADQPSTTP